MRLTQEITQSVMNTIEIREACNALDRELMLSPKRHRDANIGTTAFAILRCALKAQRQTHDALFAKNGNSLGETGQVYFGAKRGI